MWHLDNNPAPRDPSSGWLIINDVQYPPDWPRDDMIALGLEWVEPETSAQDSASLALSRLVESDLVAIRCVKDGIEYPQEWREYDDVLRAIVNGSDDDIPERPEYPEAENGPA